MDSVFTALYQSVLDDPDDDAPRLILADWLDENEQPEWAEFIRLQIAFYRSPEFAIYEQATSFDRLMEYLKQSQLKNDLVNMDSLLRQHQLHGKFIKPIHEQLLRDKTEKPLPSFSYSFDEFRRGFLYSAHISTEHAGLVKNLKEIHPIQVAVLDRPPAIQYTEAARDDPETRAVRVALQARYDGRFTTSSKLIASAEIRHWPDQRTAREDLIRMHRTQLFAELAPDKLFEMWYGCKFTCAEWYDNTRTNNTNREPRSATERLRQRPEFAHVTRWSIWRMDERREPVVVHAVQDLTPPLSSLPLDTPTSTLFRQCRVPLYRYQFEWTGATYDCLVGTCEHGHGYHTEPERIYPPVYRLPPG